ncbi:MAG: ChbG/HpnK family deacetylase [Deltaproteobacteria bacterium]|nr:ChbG/HpnK family deacetylase [Deltaproteobacteria bacterium]
MAFEKNNGKARKIIINADDLGLSPGNNTGIVNALKNGLVSSTSLMACGSAFDHAVTLLKQNQLPGVGVHLVLDEEHPVCLPSQIPSITTADGAFMARGTLLKKLIFSNQIKAEHVYAEFKAQIQKILDAGLSITHLDGHGHVHVYPKIHPIVSELALEFGITRVRVPAERFFYMDPGTFNLKKYINKVIVTSFSLLARKQFLKHNHVMPDDFMGMIFGGNLNRRNLEKVLANMPDARCVEIMAHPGDIDNQREEQYRHWQYHWAEELDALLANSKEDIREKYQYEIVSWAEVGN